MCVHDQNRAKLIPSSSHCSVSWSPDTETPSDVICDDPMTGVRHDTLYATQHWGPASGMLQL